MGRDFLIGGGTALSGPLIVLVILAALIGLGRRQGRWGTMALAATAILGAMATIIGAQEPIVARMLQESPFGLFEAVVIAVAWGGLLAGAAIVLLSLLQVVERTRRGSAI